MASASASPAKFKDDPMLSKDKRDHELRALAEEERLHAYRRDEDIETTLLRMAADRKAFEERMAAAMKAFEERMAAERKAFEERMAAAMKAFEERMAADRKAFEERMAEHDAHITSLLTRRKEETTRTAQFLTWVAERQNMQNHIMPCGFYTR